MKGRRRARRTALQALYELDLTDHDPEAVVAGRVRALYRASLSGRLTSDQLAVALALVDRCGADPASQLKPGEVATEWGVDLETADQLLHVMASIAPQAVYAGDIVRGVLANRDALDALIAKIAPEWPVSQMAPLDRNLMRVAIWEIGAQTSPVRVAINEAVELARQFSGEGARRLVNGALGTFVVRSYSFRPAGADAPAD